MSAHGVEHHQKEMLLIEKLNLEYHCYHKVTKKTRTSSSSLNKNNLKHVSIQQYEVTNKLIAGGRLH